MLDFTPPAALPAKTGARLALWGAAAVVAVVGLATVAAWLGDPFGLRKRGLERARQDQAVAEGHQAVAEGAAELGRDVLDINDRGASRDRRTVTIQEENRRDLERAPGADAPVHPDLARRFVDGLCRYAAYRADPGCAGLQRVDHPGEAGTDPGRAPADG